MIGLVREWTCRDSGKRRWWKTARARPGHGRTYAWLFGAGGLRALLPVLWQPGDHHVHSNPTVPANDPATVGRSSVCSAPPVSSCRL